MSVSTEGTVRILLTSDNHLGFLENDPIRGDDSFVSFDECLNLAQDNNCDMCIFGGDLFHEHKPSLKTLTRTMNILRTAVMGPKKPEFVIASDQKKNFASHPVPVANFSDPNYHVKLPIFAIHGNHDDLISGYSPINLLSSSGLLNYFGQVSDLENIELEPILIVKGKTRIALYGIGHIRDERLHRCFTLGKISLKIPVEEPGSNGSKWFRILVLHQNRGVRADIGKAGIYEDMLIGMADLVLWGNEHEQRAFPTEVFAAGSNQAAYDIIQPGSTIMTALHSDEASPKTGCIIEVHQSSYRVQIHTLKSIRAYKSRFIALQQENIVKQKEEVEKFLVAQVEEMARSCESLTKDIPRNILQRNPKLPLPILRVNINYSSVSGPPYPFVHPARFGQFFVGKAANPQTILHEARHTKGSEKGGQNQTYKAQFQEISTKDVKVKIEDLLKITTQNACTLLCEDSLATAVCQYAEKDEKNAIENQIHELIEGCQKSLWREFRPSVGPGKPYVVQHTQFMDKVKLFKESIAEKIPTASKALPRAIKNEDDVYEELLTHEKGESHSAVNVKNSEEDSEHLPSDDLDDFVNLRNTEVAPKAKKSSKSKAVKPKEKRPRA
ncbi:endo/exonuclease Mre11 [Perkinsela sp. CCAP 1560/4]|nr:endo/exonuclease Mre11 [Perkinsela sp. CCAP 1560/4]|eukprot:KNH06071.1 endo/exonuclease Mre11 [Perkinsela sp. CCAP 1560/4]